LTAGALPLVEPLIPPRADDRAVFTGVMYVPTTGCAWRSVTRAVAAPQGRQRAFSLTRACGCPQSRLIRKSRVTGHAASPHLDAAVLRRQPG
jgi:hypothetical protein